MRNHASVEPIGAKICTWSRVGYVIICAILLKSAQIISELRHFLYLAHEYAIRRPSTVIQRRKHIDRITACQTSPSACDVTADAMVINCLIVTVSRTHDLTLGDTVILVLEYYQHWRIFLTFLRQTFCRIVIE